MVLLRNVCIILISIICCLCINQQCTADSAVDISWDFGDGSDLQGWADATAAEMQSRVTLHGGEMQGVILGLSPNVASPLMAVFVKNRHYLVLRMAYSGKSSMGELLISRGHLTEDSQDYINYRKFTWSDYKPPVALVGSPSSSSGSGIAATIDSSSNTYYLSASAAGVYIIYDLGDYRWVTGFEITPLQGGNSPRKCLLQRSLTFSDRGPYETASTFTLNSTVAVNDTVTGVRIIIGLSAHARYWRLLVIDNYGGMGVGIRHIAFTGYANSVDVVPFILNNTGDYITYYLPMTVRDITSPPVIRVRLNFFPALISSPSILTELGSFQIDFVRIARAPEIFRVTGCLDLYFSNSSLLEPSYSLNSVVDIINGNLPNSYYTMGHIIPVNKLYASTYSCPRDGGLDITIQGSNFGESANVLIGANSCLVISREKIRIGGVVFDTIICTLPATNSALLTSHIKVRVQNGVLPNLFDEYPGLQYEMVPYPPTAPNVTNIGARRVDLVWQPSNSVLENLVVTGYKIAWSTPVTTSSSTSTATSTPHGGSFTVGNVTTTSIRGLSRDTEYIFRIAAMSEGVVPLNAAALPTDQYGRREPAPLALISSFSEFSQTIVTLKEDFQFTLFNANLIQNHTKKIDPDHLSSGASVGPTGQYGGEGQYGLTFVGFASIQNCNASSTCCDGYNIFNGSSSCISTSLVCAVLPSRQFYKSLIIDGHRLTQISSINNDPDDGLPSTYLFTYDLFSSLTGLNPPSSICGPAIRLTSSAAREVGATWYDRKGS